MDPEFSQEALTYIVNHVALPPQLPQGREKDTAEGERALLALLLDHVEAFYGRCPPADKDSWTKVRRALLYSVPAHNNGALSSDKIKIALNSLGPQGMSAAVPCLTSILISSRSFVLSCRGSERRSLDSENDLRSGNI